MFLSTLLAALVMLSRMIAAVFAPSSDAAIEGVPGGTFVQQSAMGSAMNDRPIIVGVTDRASRKERILVYIAGDGMAE